MFSSIAHGLHWAFLLESGAALEVRGRRAYVACGAETRSLDMGDMSGTDLRVLCAGALRDARAKLSRYQWGALCARFGHGAVRADGFAVLIEGCSEMAASDLTVDAVALFGDAPVETAGARLLSGVRAALVGHAVAALPADFLAGRIQAP